MRAVYVLGKLSDVSGPGLEEAGRYRLGPMGNVARRRQPGEAAGDGARRYGGPTAARRSGMGRWARRRSEETAQRASVVADPKKVGLQGYKPT